MWPWKPFKPLPDRVLTQVWPWPSRTASWSHPGPDFSLMLAWDHRLKLTVGQWWRPAACSPSLCQTFTPVLFEVKRFSSDNRPKHRHVQRTGPLWHHQTNIRDQSALVWPHGQETGLSHADRTHAPLFHVWSAQNKVFTHKCKISNNIIILLLLLVLLLYSIILILF